MRLEELMADEVEALEDREALTPPSSGPLNAKTSTRVPEFRRADLDDPPDSHAQRINARNRRAMGRP